MRGQAARPNASNTPRSKSGPRNAANDAGFDWVPGNAKAGDELSLDTPIRNPQGNEPFHRITNLTP